MKIVNSYDVQARTLAWTNKHLPLPYALAYLNNLVKSGSMLSNWDQEGTETMAKMQAEIIEELNIKSPEEYAKYLEKERLLAIERWKERQKKRVMH